LTNVTEIIAAINALDHEQLSPLLIAIAAKLAEQPKKTADIVSGVSTLVDADTLAAALQLKKSQLMTLARQKKIPSIKVGKYVRFDVAEVAAALKATPANVDKCQHSR
jgi:excisionase family DNA binding protein